MLTVTERFWAKVNKNGPTPLACPQLGRCWLWTGTPSQKYGLFWDVANYIKAHQFSWKLHRGEIASGLCVCHHCDESRCVNPAHLFLGTSAENAADMVQKKRQARGETNGQSTLTERQVRMVFILRKKGVLQRKIAERFNCSQVLISKILGGRAWMHLGLASPTPIGRAKGEANGRATLNSEKALRIIELRKQRFTLSQIAKEIGCSMPGVSHVLAGRVWSHVTNVRPQ